MNIYLLVTLDVFCPEPRQSLLLSTNHPGYVWPPSCSQASEPRPVENTERRKIQVRAILYIKYLKSVLFKCIINLKFFPQGILTHVILFIVGALCSEGAIFKLPCN